MTNDEYRALWSVNDGTKTFIVLRSYDEQEYGNIVVASDVDETALLQRGKEKGIYPQDAFLVEIVEDFDNLAQGVDIN
jgi:hypothetical protein